MKMEQENNGGDDATAAVAVDVDADDSVMPNAVSPQFNYVRRRKCNENVPICEKKKKRESFRRVSVVVICSFFTNTCIRDVFMYALCAKHLSILMEFRRLPPLILLPIRT